MHSEKSFFQVERELKPDQVIKLPVPSHTGIILPYNGHFMEIQLLI
jgi:hypothetical protein